MEEDIEEHSSEDDVSVKSIPSRTSVAIEPIDLTRDESEINEVFTLDSIHEASSDGRRGGLIAGQHVDVGIASEICNLPSAGIDNPVILDNTDGEEDDPISDADSLSDAGDSEIHGSDFYGSESGSEHENDNEEHIVGVGGEAVIFSLSQQVQQMSDARIFPHVKDQSVKEASPRSVLHTYIEPSQNKMKEDDNDNDDESNFSLSDASAEGIRALFGEDLFGNGGQNQYFNDRDDDAESLVACQSISKSSQQTESLEPPRHVTFASPSSDTTADIASSFSRYHTIDDSISTLSTAQTMQATQALAQGLSVHRLPSPSDAAMVKTATLITTVPRETANPVKVHHLPSRDWRLLTAHSLGDKTGKHAFFEAREGNRARFYAGENDWPKESSITSQPIDATLEQLQVRRKPQSLTAIKSLGQKVEKDLEIVGTATGGCSLSKPASSSPGFGESSGTRLCDVPLISPANPLVTPSSFLGARTLSPTMDSNASPEAVIETTMKYNESKSSTVFSKNLNQSAPLQPVRSGLSIDDIIERSSADQSQNLKRKSEGISDVLEKEERAWERPSNLDGSNSSAENPTVDSNLSSSLVESIEVTDKLVLELPDHRPSKRLKKFVEAVSYAALGGAAVGAGLFSVLVATAPEFL